MPRLYIHVFFLWNYWAEFWWSFIIIGLHLNFGSGECKFFCKSRNFPSYGTQNSPSSSWVPPIYPYAQVSSITRSSKAFLSCEHYGFSESVIIIWTIYIRGIDFCVPSYLFLSNCIIWNSARDINNLHTWGLYIHICVSRL